jgi:hypothetical protein
MARCQSALKFDPGSAGKVDPGRRVVHGVRRRTRASRSDRHESDPAMRGGYLWAPEGEPRGEVRRIAPPPVFRWARMPGLGRVAAKEVYAALDWLGASGRSSNPGWPAAT